MNPRDPNVHLVDLVAQALGDLRDELVFERRRVWNFIKLVFSEEGCLRSRSNPCCAFT